MIDIKKIHPGLSYLNNLQYLSEEGFLNLASEKTDIPPHAILLKAAQKAIAGGCNQYSDINGYLPLREKVSEFIKNEYSYTYNSDDEVTITAGASQAISSAISAFIHEGDEVVLFEPSFYSYGLMIMANGGRPVYIRMKHPDFHIDWDEVQKVINARTKMVIINTPHYPTGAIFSVADMEKLAKLINGTNIVVLSDESFKTIIFERYEHQSIARFPKLAEHSLLISSFGKSMCIEGWKLGYCVAPSKLTAIFRKIHCLQTFSVNTPLQVALADIFPSADIFAEGTRTYEMKRNSLLNGLKSTRLKFIPSKGSYFQVLNYSNISESKDTDFCQKLLKEYKIAVMPLSFFYHDANDYKCIRLCFARNDDILNRAIEIFNQL